MQPNLVKSFLFALAASAVEAATHRLGSKCGAPSPSVEVLEAAASMAIAEAEAAANGTLAERQSATVNIDTYVHIVATSTSVSGGYLSDSVVQSQISVLNADYASSGFQFVLKGTDRTVNSNWANDNAESTMKRSLRKGTYKDLNLYFLPGLKDDTLGYCTFPTTAASGSTNFILDGCTCGSATVPGGSLTNYNLGRTATHEIGHWLGLFHTFEGGCADRDLVADTPAQASFSTGCPTGRDSCPDKAGLDPITNYMDYSYDSCMDRFTPGQNTRMKSMWNQYRAGK